MIHSKSSKEDFLKFLAEVIHYANAVDYVIKSFFSAKTNLCELNILQYILFMQGKRPVMAKLNKPDQNLV